MASFEVFLEAYIECAFWLSYDESDENGGKPLDENYGPGDLAPSAREKLESDARKFFDANQELFTEEPASAGHDFWLTRNGHGCGFWDGDWMSEAGSALTAASKQFGECFLYVGDDGMVYAS
jgi:hypothetical protein